MDASSAPQSARLTKQQKTKDSLEELATAPNLAADAGEYKGGAEPKQPAASIKSRRKPELEEMCS